jgi:hypothetical protein
MHQATGGTVAAWNTKAPTRCPGAPPAASEAARAHVMGLISANRHDASLPGATLERQTRSTVTVDRQGRQRAGDGVAELYEAGTITLADVRSSQRWLRAYSLGVAGTGGGADNMGIRGTGGPAGYSDAKLDAAAAHFRAAQAMGPIGTAIMVAIVAEGRTMRDLGDDDTCGTSKTIKVRLLRQLALLTAHYASEDASKAPAAPHAIRSAKFKMD